MPKIEVIKIGLLNRYHSTKKEWMTTNSDFHYKKVLSNSVDFKVHKLHWLFLTTCSPPLTFPTLTKSGYFWTTYPPPLVNVVCERPLMENLPHGLIPLSPSDFQAFPRPWSKVEQGPMSDIVYWSSLMTLFFSPCLSEYSRATLFLQGQKQST